MNGDDFARLAYLGILLVAVGGWLIIEYRGRMGAALRTALAWGLIIVGLMAGYGLWTDIRTTYPDRAMVVDGHIEVPRSPDGHYYLSLEIGSESVDFLVDTGATNVVLTPKDARRLGIDPDSLMYLGEAQTANGTVRTARVKLSDVDLGPFHDGEITAWVNDGDMEGSLLGMDYLGLYNIEITEDRMILRR
jgi:aspartyl protease family protein